MISCHAGQRFHYCCTEVCGILWLDWRTELKPEPFSEDELRCHSLLSRCRTVVIYFSSRAKSIGDIRPANCPKCYLQRERVKL